MVDSAFFANGIDIFIILVLLKQSDSGPLVLLKLSAILAQIVQQPHKLASRPQSDLC